MFGLFKKTTEAEKLQKQYEKLLKESFNLSKSNRSASDAKMAEAEAIQDKIMALK
ncbi:Lacal_2735 family protein [Lacinutrix sp. Bg11-31]|uniref:Lacal_2735 family protein n=1 Tax=Lacinutrix sp. Bg11-31 TaxID=2057808 RepID=UPI0012FE5F61|nr:Lacal_2735 family protein [Lacinutrix sp. Bg11-31]